MAPWNDPVIRGWVFQVAAVGLVIALVGSGFDFLAQAAGFEISDSPIPYSPSDTYGRAIVAAYLTVSLSISLFMNWYNKRLALTER